MTRECTNWILESISEGTLDPMEVVRACMCHMSEDEVKDMVHSNELGWPGNDNYSGRDDDDETEGDDK
jgi:hypothetical protein